MNQFSSYEYLCPHCGKPSKVGIERFNVADSFIVDKIDANTGALSVSKQRYEHKSEAELTDDTLFCASCGEVLLNEHNNQMQWHDVLEELAANFENTPASYYIDRVDGVSDISRIEHCDKLVKLLKETRQYLGNDQKPSLEETAKQANLDGRIFNALVQAGYLKKEIAA